MRASFPIVCMVTCLLGAPVSESASLPISSDNDGWDIFSVEKHGDPIVLPVDIARNRYLFLLDSAGTHHILDVSLREFAGSSVSEAHVVAPGKADLALEKAKLPRMRVGTFDASPLNDDTVLLWDFAPLRHRMEQNVRGALGAPFFRDKLVQIDFDRGTLRITARDRAKDDFGYAIPLRLDDAGRMWIDNVWVANRLESFRIATGRNHTMVLHHWLFQALETAGDLRLVAGHSVGQTAAGEFVAQVARLTSFRCGPHEHRDLIVHEGDVNSVGLRYLARYVVTIDATGRRMYLRPGVNYNRRDKEGRDIGLVADRVGGVLVVGVVKEGGPAQVAGVQQGDELLEIDGTPCADMKVLKVNQLLQDSTATKLRLKLDRQGTVLEVTLDVDEPDADQ